MHLCEVLYRHGGNAIACQGHLFEYVPLGFPQSDARLPAFAQPDVRKLAKSLTLSGMLECCLPIWVDKHGPWASLSSIWANLESSRPGHSWSATRLLTCPKFALGTHSPMSNSTYVYTVISTDICWGMSIDIFYNQKLNQCTLLIPKSLSP
jgi:hypothetical protein